MDSLLLDNDIYYVLAGTDTLDDFLALLQVSDENVYVLPTLKRVVQGHTSTYAPEQRGRCCEYYARFRETILSEEEEDRVCEFTKIKKIDDGEARLLARLTSGGDRDLMTKDTNFVGALGKLPEEYKEKVKGRIMVLEHVLLFLYLRYGHAYMVEHIAPFCAHDKKLMVLLSAGGQADEESFAAGLQSYINKARNKYGELLYTFDDREGELS